MDVVSLAAEFPNDNPALHAGARWLCLDVTGPAVAVLPITPAPVPAPTAAPAVEPPSAVAVERSPIEAAIEGPVPSMSVAELLTEEAEAIPEARISGVVGLGETPRDESAFDLVAAMEDLDEDEPIVVEDLPPLEESATVEGLAPVLELDLTILASQATPAAASTTIAPPPPDDPWVVLVAVLADVAIAAGSPHVASVLPGLLVDGVLAPLPADAMKALAEANVVSGNDVHPAFRAQTHAWIGILRGTSDDFGACGNAMLDEWAADLMARLLGAPGRANALKRDLRAHGVAAFGLAA
ncbi:MAG TPA: hypothetical protein VLT33_11435 [Labilithrix sp.]|nr:hypothetical protein [Labilithrix sp.]